MVRGGKLGKSHVYHVYTSQEESILVIHRENWKDLTNSACTFRHCQKSQTMRDPPSHQNLKFASSPFPPRWLTSCVNGPLPQVQRESLFVTWGAVGKSRCYMRCSGKVWLLPEMQREILFVTWGAAESLIVTWGAAGKSHCYLRCSGKVSLLPEVLRESFVAGADGRGGGDHVDLLSNLYLVLQSLM